MCGGRALPGTAPIGRHSGAIPEPRLGARRGHQSSRGARKPAGSSLFFVYREYTPDNTARPALSQNLTYEADAKIIRYRDVKIEVLSATSETIDFRVLKD